MKERDDEFLELVRRVELLEQEVRELKEQQTIKQPPPKRTPIEKKTIQRKEKENKDWEKVLGQIWLPRIFLFVLIFGIVWGFKIAVDVGFLTEPVRIVVGYAAVVSFLFLGKQQIDKKRGPLGIVLLGGAIVISMITTFAAHVLYGYIPNYVALLLNVATIAGGIYISKRYKNEPLANIVAVGGFIIPFLLESNNPSPYVFVGFEFILYMSLIFYALKERLVSVYLTSTVLFQLVMIVFAFVDQFNHLGLLASTILIQHLFLLIILIQKNVYVKAQLSTMFGSFAMTLLWLYYSFPVRMADLYLAGLIILYGVLAYYFWNKKEVQSRIFLAITTFAVLILMLRLFDSSAAGVTFVAEGFIAILLGNYLKTTMQKRIGQLLYAVGLLLVFSEWMETFVSIETISWIAAVGTLYWLMKHEMKNEAKVYFMLFLAYLLLFVSQCAWVVTGDASEYVKQMVLSFTWAFFAIGAVIYGVKKNQQKMRLFGVIFIFVTLLKIIVIDLPTVSLLIRTVLFIGVGGIGIVMSRMLYKKEEKEEK